MFLKKGHSSDQLKSNVIAFYLQNLIDFYLIFKIIIIFLFLMLFLVDGFLN